MTCENRNRRSRVLVVEDDPFTAEAIRRLLERRGFAVRTAVDLEEAVACSEGWPPDLAICDWHLARLPDGLQTARVLRRRHGARIVMMTGSELDAMTRAATDLTVDEFLRKPLGTDVLLATVRRSLRKAD